MSQSDIARFHPVPMGEGSNNPDAASQARRRIAELPDPYAETVAPPKEELVGAVHPVSPAAEATMGSSGTITDVVASSQLQISRAVAGGTERVKQSAASVGQAAGSVLPRKLSPVEQAAQAPETPLSAGTQAAEVPTSTTMPTPSFWKRWGKPAITGLITFVLLFMLFKAPIFWNQLGYLTGDQTTTEPTQTNNAVTPIAATPQISIPKINVTAPIVFAQSNQEAAIQKDLESGVVHYAHTALPGEPGNSVIFGHSSNDWWEPGNYKFVFVLLDKLVLGDTFTVDYNSQQYIYKVVETKVVEPTDLSVLNATPTPQLTLITCTPPGTSWKRLVVRAEQISPTPSAVQTAAATNNGDQLQSLPGSSPSIGEQLGKWWDGLTGIFN